MRILVKFFLQKSDGKKTSKISGIPKLEDANWAGTKKSSQCYLILTEGDSAKAGIVSGLSSDDRNTIGVYPMKGKLFNVRGESVTKIGDNKEITEIKLSKDFEYDDIMIYQDNSVDDSNLDLNKLLEGVVEKYMENNEGVVFDNDGN